MESPYSKKLPQTNKKELNKSLPNCNNSEKLNQSDQPRSFKKWENQLVIKICKRLVSF